MHPRHSVILELVNTAGRISVVDLSSQLGVSEVTVRQDLTHLENHGFLKRVHGAAVVLDSDDPEHRIWANSKIKQDIAHYAASFVHHDECVLIEGGSVNVMLAKTLSERPDITIVTSSAYIAHTVRNGKADIILLGGHYQQNSESLVGPLTRLCIEQIHFSKAFLGVDGFDIQTGFTNRNMMRADIANAILGKGQENFILSDSTKFGRIFPASIGEIQKIKHVISDRSIPINHMNHLKEAGVNVHIV